MIRDQIWLALTVDSLKKAEVMLLFADKRLEAGKILIEGGKVDLGLTTLTKGEKYLEQAINQAKIAQSKNKDAQSFLAKLHQASLKHREVLLEIESQIPEANQATIEDLLKYTQN